MVGNGQISGVCFNLCQAVITPWRPGARLQINITQVEATCNSHCIGLVKLMGPVSLGI